MKESVALLYEGLYELSQLADEAQNRSPYLYEGTGYSPLQVIMLEAEGEEGFLQRTSSAIEKVKKAAKSGVVELEKLSQNLGGVVPPMSNSQEAVNAAVGDLKKKMPGDGFVSKLGALGSGAWSALFGEKDDPIEAVTQIVAEGLQFKTMLNNIVKSVLDLLDDIEPVAVVEDAADDAAEEAGDAGAEISDEEKKKYIEDLKNLLMDGTINDILTSEDGMYPEVREVTGFSEKNIVDALKKSAKPSKWFSGLKSVGASLGLGLGGDLPFKKYGLTQDGIIEDIKMVKVSELQKMSGTFAPTSGDKAVADELASGVEDVSDLESQASDLEDQQAAPSDQSQPDDPGSTTQPTSQPGDTGAEPPADDSTKTSYIKILKSVPGLREPEGAADKLAQLLAAGFEFMPAAGLKNLLAEKVLRYDDVVSALSDHLPEEESEIPSAIKKLADEMKVELGSEFDIVGAPDAAREELAALRAEIEALRRMIQGLPEEEQEAAADSVSASLEDEAGLDADIVDDILDPSVSLDDVIDNIPAENIEDIEDAIPDDVDDIEPDDDKPTRGPDAEKGVKQKREAGTYWKLPSGRKGKKQWAAKKKSGGKAAEFAKEESAAAYSLKERIARIAVAKMRGYILSETNDFRYASNLSPAQVVSEFYSRGGSNRDITHRTKPVYKAARWVKIAGLENE